MMGNFLTTLGNEPETDREMFEELGLNVARQPDNGANPRPGQPLGLARGRDAGRRRAAARAHARRDAAARRERLGDDADDPPVGPLDAAALPRRSARCRRARTGRRTAARRRERRRASASRSPDGERAARRERAGGIDGDATGSRSVWRARARGLTAACGSSSGPQGPTVLLDGQPVLLLCSNNYLGLADHPRVREAAAEQRCAGASAPARRG